MLETAVVDICMLVATCHAMKAGAREEVAPIQDRLRRRLRRQLWRGTLAYLGKLARAKRDEADDRLLARCRRAAEHEMPDAIAHQDLLSRIMAGERGALEGMVAARQDLWRLSQLAARLRAAVLAMVQPGRRADADRLKHLARRLRRRLRRSLLSYADTLLGAPGTTGRQISLARRRALAEIGKQGMVEAGRLAQIEAGPHAGGTALSFGLQKALAELALDWADPKPRA